MWNLCKYQEMMKMIKMIFLLHLDLDGLVAHVFSTKSKEWNEFLAVRFKIAEATCVTLRIMKQANQTITENYLKILNQETESVTS